MDPNAVQDAPPAPADTPAPALDVNQIKSMLNLPDTASDIELVTALVELIGNLQQKYDALLSDAVTLEDKVVNRDLEDFKDVIGPEAQEFWKGLLIANRDQTVGVLAKLRENRTALAPAKPAAGEAGKAPLRNRLADQPRSLGELAGQPVHDVGRAVAIRNRAHDLRKTEHLAWSEAFARAEKEMNK